MHLRLDGEAAQIAFGRRLAEHLRPPLVIYLEGDLGTGKTTLARGVLRALGHEASVRSPTYTLLEPYELRTMRLFHLDLYRIGEPQELEYLGLRDLMEGDCVLLVEWPERGKGALPTPDLIVRIAHAGEGRVLELAAEGPRGAELEARLRETES